MKKCLDGNLDNGLIDQIKVKINMYLKCLSNSKKMFTINSVIDYNHAEKLLTATKTY